MSLSIVVFTFIPAFSEYMLSQILEGTEVILVMGQETLRYRRKEPGIRRRTQSLSRAEEIVDCEQKARRAQPDHPFHTHIDSLLSFSSDFRNYEGIFYWGLFMLFLSSLRVCIENLLNYGARWNIMGSWKKFFFGDEFSLEKFPFPVLYLLVYSLVPPVITLILEQNLAKSRLEWKTGLVLHILNLCLHMSMPVIMINLMCLNIGLISSVLACSIYTITFLKLTSYIQVNKWCREAVMRIMPGNGDFFLKKRKKTLVNLMELNQKTEKNDIDVIDKKLVHWPGNLTMRDISFFMVSPTLCYELNYPRNDRIRKSFLMYRYRLKTINEEVRSYNCIL